MDQCNVLVAIQISRICQSRLDSDSPLMEGKSVLYLSRCDVSAMFVVRLGHCDKYVCWIQDTILEPIILCIGLRRPHGVLSQRLLSVTSLPREIVQRLVHGTADAAR